MAPTEDLRTVALGANDAEAGYRLSTEAGWNQTVEDWRLMLFEGEGRGQVTPAGELVASALIMPYEKRLAWVAMVLTTEKNRRQGLATRNLRWAIDRCRELGLSAGLDATPDGREVYLPLGFEDVYALHRWRADRVVLPAVPPSDVAVAPLDGADMAALDAVAFGARRDVLLRYLQTNRPDVALVATSDGHSKGFILARSGRGALHLGPLTATSSAVAVALLVHALRHVRGPVSIDVPDHQTAVVRLLEAAGFQPVRPFFRMVRDAKAAMGDPACTFAIAGPELG